MHGTMSWGMPPSNILLCRQRGTHPALPRHGQQPRAPARSYPRGHGMQPFPHGEAYVSLSILVPHAFLTTVPLFRAGPRGPAPPFALPPARFPGAASLVSQLDSEWPPCLVLSLRSIHIPVGELEAFFLFLLCFFLLSVDVVLGLFSLRGRAS